MDKKNSFKDDLKLFNFKNIKVHFVLFLNSLLMSIFYIVNKIALVNIPVFLFLIIVLIISIITLWIMGFIFDRKEMFKIPSKKEWLFLILSGLFVVTFNQSFFLLGISYSTASNAALAQPAIPIFSTIFGVLLGYEKKSKLKFLGIAIAVIGCILMVDFTHLISAENSSPKDILLGNLCFLGNTLSFALFLIVQHPLIEGGMSSIKCMCWSFLIGSIPILLIFSCTTFSNNLFNQLKLISFWPGWISILYSSIFATSLCFLISSWAVGKSNVVTVAVYLCIEPIITLLLAKLTLGENLTILNIIGGIVIVFGVMMVMVSKYKESLLIINEENKLLLTNDQDF